MNSIKRSFSIVLVVSFVLSMLIFAQPVSAAEAKWLWPVPASRSISQRYGGHDGLDITADSNVPIVASKSGTVVRYFVGCNNYNGYYEGCSSKGGCSPNAGYYAPLNGTCNYGYGNGLVIDHGDGTFSQYAHLSSLNVQNGAYVSQGQQIGVMGSTGNSTGRHLHFCLSYSAYAGYSFDNNIESIDYIYSLTTQSPSISLDTDSWRYSIGSTNAVVCANINNPNGGTISTIGCHLYNEEDEYIYCHSEEVNPSYKNATTVPMWTDFNADVHYYLQPGTKYQYRLYAYIDGVEYCSELASFTTTGTPPSVVLDNTSPKYQITENNAVLFANINNPYVGKIGVVGCHLYNSQGNYIFHHYEEINSDLALNTSVPFTVDLLQDAGYILQPNTTYQYRLYAYINDMKYTSELASFTTASTNKPPVSSDDPSIPDQPSVPQPPVETPFMGDLDDDGNINAKDALEVLKAAVGKVNLTEEQKTAADVNKDGDINAKDALEILKHSVGKPSVLDKKQ